MDISEKYETLWDNNFRKYQNLYVAAWTGSERLPSSKPAAWHGKEHIAWHAKNISCVSLLTSSGDIMTSTAGKTYIWRAAALREKAVHLVVVADAVDGRCLLAGGQTNG